MTLSVYRKSNWLCCLFLALLSLSSAVSAYTVNCFTRAREPYGAIKYYNYGGTRARPSTRYRRYAAAKSFQKCKRLSRNPKSCRFIRCKAASYIWRCGSYYRYRRAVSYRDSYGRLRYSYKPYRRSFYRLGYTKRNASYRAIRACATNPTRRRLGTQCYRIPLSRCRLSSYRKY